MAEYHLPEIDDLTEVFNRKMREHLQNLADFADAIKSGNDPVEIMDNWEVKQLLRQLPPDSPEC
ncbi:MAG: hypothetical protein AABN95_16210 [Acidobacteriota bacterium]